MLQRSYGCSHRLRHLAAPKPFPRQPWPGLILSTAILRVRGLTTHLLPLAAGFKQSTFRPRGREGALERLEGFRQVVEEAVAIGSKDLNRLILARELMRRVPRTCRSNSKLSQLVTVPLAAKLLTVTPKAIDLMLIQPGGALPRELTGRGCLRA